MDPFCPQAELLDELTNKVSGMPELFEDAQRKRDLYQRRLTDMIEETLRQIIKVRLGMDQKARQVRDTMTSYASKFDHDLSCAREEFRRDLEERASRIEDTLDSLEEHIAETEVDLKKEHEFRVQHVEETLGPIRDEVLRLSAALEDERKTRRGEEAAREKLLTDQVDAFTKLLDAEKFERGRQLGEFHDMVQSKEQSVAKRQYQVEQETQNKVQASKQELEGVSKERITVQHRVVESIASFVKRYHEQLGTEAEDAAKRMQSYEEGR